MSRTTREINRITTAIISISLRLLVGAVLVFLLYEGVTRGYQFGHAVFSPEAVSEAPGHDQTWVIEKGDSLLGVSKELEEAGLIPDAYVFAVQAKLYKYTLCPGTYLLNSSMTSRDILQKIDEKRTVTEDETDTDDRK